MNRERQNRVTTTVVIVDDHRAFAESLALALDTQTGLECVGTAATVEEALEVVGERQPAIVVMDAYLPGTDGVEGTRRVLEIAPETHVVILTGHAEVDLLAQAAQAGAAGFLSKEAAFSEIVDALRSVSEGTMLVAPETLGDLVDRTRRSSIGRRSESVALTDREYEILVLLAEGADPRTIAGLVGISVHTCRGHVKNLLLKLGAHSQLQAVVTAAHLGLLPGHPLGGGPGFEGA